MNTLPQAPKSFDRFEGQDHGTRGTGRFNVSKVSPDHTITDPGHRELMRGLTRTIDMWKNDDIRLDDIIKAREFTQADKAIVDSEIAQGIIDYRETPTTTQQIISADWNDDYYKDLGKEWEEEVEFEEDPGIAEAYALNGMNDEERAVDAYEERVASEAYAENARRDAIAAETPVTREGTRRVRHRQEKRLGSSAIIR